MLTKTVAALETQAVLNKIVAALEAVATLEAEATPTESVAAMEHVETLDTMRSDGHLRAEESNDVTIALSDGADFERHEDNDQVLTTKGNTLDHAGGGRDKVSETSQPAPPILYRPACPAHRLAYPRCMVTTRPLFLATDTDGRRAHGVILQGAITCLTPLLPK